jgi:predicted kinase
VTPPCSVELAVLAGLQASGKSSFAQEHLAGSHEIVSKDDWPNARNRQRRQLRLLHEHLAAGRSVAVDNTNPAVADRAPLLAAARGHGARAVCYWFPPDVAACVARNAARPGRARVPDVGLYHTLARLEPPTAAEGFDAIHDVRLDGDRFVVSVRAGRDGRG